jgi:hypothetical protein
MAAVTDPGPDGRGPDPRLRAVAVVALLCVAAVALRARQGLDWAELADPVEVHWARVLLGTVLLLAVIAALRRLLRRLRKPRRPRGAKDDGTEPEGEPFPWTLRGLGLLLVLAVCGLVWFVVNSMTPADPARRNPPARLVTGTPGQRDAGPGLDTAATWQVLLLVGTVLLVATLGPRWLAARRAVEVEVDPAEEERAEVELLVGAVDAADAELRSSADPREAVLAAYAAMARHLAQGLARRGRGARPSDTAGELLDHAVAAGLVSGAPARTLTDLFREARFSEHPIGEQARSTARECLAEVRGELTARRG